MSLVSNANAFFKNLMRRELKVTTAVRKDQPLV